MMSRQGRYKQEGPNTSRYKQGMKTARIDLLAVQHTCHEERSQESNTVSCSGRLTRSNDLCKALAGGQEDKKLAKVGEEAEVEKE